MIGQMPFKRLDPNTPFIIRNVIRVGNKYYIENLRTFSGNLRKPIFKRAAYLCQAMAARIASIRRLASVTTPCIAYNRAPSKSACSENI